MSEDPTLHLPHERFENRVLAELLEIRTRLSSLEEKVDARLQETRPIWEAIATEINRFHSKLGNIIQDLYEVRTDIRVDDKRLHEIENRPSEPFAFSVAKS